MCPTDYDQQGAKGSSHYLQQGVGRGKFENHVHSKFALISELVRYVFGPPWILRTENLPSYPSMPIHLHVILLVTMVAGIEGVIGEGFTILLNFPHKSYFLLIFSQFYLISFRGCARLKFFPGGTVGISVKW